MVLLSTCSLQNNLFENATFSGIRLEHTRGLQNMVKPLLALNLAGRISADLFTSMISEVGYYIIYGQQQRINGNVGVTDGQPAALSLLSSVPLCFHFPPPYTTISDAPFL